MRQNVDRERQVLEIVSGLIATFSRDVASLYDAADRQRGYIVAKDREGAVKKFPLLSVSAAVLKISPGERLFSVDTIGSHIAYLKKIAKISPDHLAFAEINLLPVA